MGARGPKPKSQEELRRRNSWRAKIIKAAPKTIYGRPYTPRKIEHDVHLIWRNLMPELETSGVLQPIHRHVLLRYCKLAVLARKTEEMLRAAGNTAAIEFQKKKGKTVVKSIKEFPQFNHLMKIYDQMLKIEDRFGMNPSARTRIMLPTHGTNEKKDTQRDKDNARFFGKA